MHVFYNAKKGMFCLFGDSGTDGQNLELFTGDTSE